MIKRKPGDGATLEEEVARYHNLDWQPLALAPLRGSPPYASQICAPTFLSPTRPASTLLEARDRLSSQVRELQEVLHLQKQSFQLSTELALLQTSLKETALTPTPSVSAEATST